MRRAPQASYPRRAPATLYASRSNSADPGDQKRRRRRRRRRGGDDGERIRLPRSAHGPDHGFAWLNLAPEETTTKAKDWGEPDQGEAAARTTREARTRGADWLLVRREAALGCLLYYYFSPPDMWVRIVGSQYAVRRYWDQETDKRGVVL